MKLTKTNELVEIKCLRCTYKWAERQTHLALRNGKWIYSFLARTEHDIHETGGMVARFEERYGLDPFWLSAWISSAIIPEQSELITPKDWEKWKVFRKPAE